MASRERTRIKEARKLTSEARFTFGSELTGVDKVKDENRRLLASLAEPLAPDDSLLTAIGKEAMTRYLDRVDLPAEEAVPRMDAGPEDPVLQTIYGAYLNLSEAPCNARYPHLYIPTPEELQAMRDALPAIPEAWVEDLEERRDAAPARHTLKATRGREEL
jgi:hypothetical protein